MGPSPVLPKAQLDGSRDLSLLCPAFLTFSLKKRMIEGERIDEKGDIMHMQHTCLRGGERGRLNLVVGNSRAWKTDAPNKPFEMSLKRGPQVPSACRFGLPSCQCHAVHAVAAAGYAALLDRAVSQDGALPSRLQRTGKSERDRKESE